MEGYADIYYVQRVQAGESACFGCLLDRYGRAVYALIVRIVRNREDAEELAQDVFLKAYKSLGNFRGESSFSTWIYKIAYHAAISHVRKKKHEFLAMEEGFMENLPEEDVAGTFGEDASGAEAERLDRLDGALARLAADERGLILLFYMKEKTIEDLVSITGLSASNVKTRLHRIRKKLWVLLKDTEDIRHG
ncbi:MAG: sigma-70 family RNA polymerase sigma factor [Tannerellaceae bacterium]|jgi:RNA polymerase sigma-70 factor (ECF subfamily)|nr:sigma-70 family RNA polymerase sigma factor [Tannerellaceae bacterium]